MKKTHQTREDYCLIKNTNCVIKWTSIMSALLIDYEYCNGSFDLLVEYWETIH